MTRREEIEHKAGSITDGMIAHYVPERQCKSYYEGYIDGANYADKTRIEKACKWIKKEVLDDYQGVIWNNIVEDFRKAMDE